MGVHVGVMSLAPQGVPAREGSAAFNGPRAMRSAPSPIGGGGNGYSPPAGKAAYDLGLQQVDGYCLTGGVGHRERPLQSLNTG